MLPPKKAQYVPLPAAAHGVRYFPQENKTKTPIFNNMRPNPSIKRDETPKRDNLYRNWYDSAKSILADRTRLSGINEWFYPPIDFVKK